ncbi:hypothetical protein TUSST3_32240 [Streptomyces sp. TUS-ST3]|nr:hypothetical protein TUSST3_32240 [Streptomyces sp. TUS-ST3]
MWTVKSRPGPSGGVEGGFPGRASGAAEGGFPARAQGATDSGLPARARGATDSGLPARAQGPWAVGSRAGVPLGSGRGNPSRGCGEARTGAGRLEQWVGSVRAGETGPGVASGGVSGPPPPLSGGTGP